MWPRRIAMSCGNSLQSRCPLTVLSVAGALLFSGCAVLGPLGDLPIPPADQVKTEVKEEGGLTVSLVVGDAQDDSNDHELRVGDSVPVFVKVTNNGTVDQWLWPLQMGDPERAKPVARTAYGESMKNRRYWGGGGGSAFGHTLRVGETRYAVIRLSALFRLEEAGTYTLIAEPAPVWEGTPVQVQTDSSVRVTFNLDPDWVNFRGNPLLAAPTLFPQKSDPPTTQPLPTDQILRTTNHGLSDVH